MLYSIKGKITDIMPGAVAVENNGVAFSVNVPDNSYCFIAKPDETVCLYTAMLVKEDDISLYGFTDKESLALFRLLMTVQGIGAKAACAILSTGTAREIKHSIILEDYASIQRANGVGKKTAQRVVLELKEKLEASEDFSGSETSAAAQIPSDDKLKNQACLALTSLGFSKAEALAALMGIKASSVEEYISLALRNR